MKVQILSRNNALSQSDAPMLKKLTPKMLSSVAWFAVHSQTFFVTLFPKKHECLTQELVCVTKKFFLTLFPEKCHSWTLFKQEVQIHYTCEYLTLPVWKSVIAWHLNFEMFFISLEMYLYLFCSKPASVLYSLNTITAKKLRKIRTIASKISFSWNNVSWKGRFLLLYNVEPQWSSG